jgi:hypothetical protein
MAYSINKTNGTIVATVEDGTLDTTTSLSLIGRNYQGYGEVFNENLVKLLENSASASTPSAPIIGELWYDTSDTNIKVFDGGEFAHINAVRASASTPTASLQKGVLWYNTSSSSLNVYNGSSFDSIGPITILDEDDFASNSATGVPSQQSTKAYIQSVVVDSNALPIRDESSNSISATFTDGLLIRGTGGISTAVDTDSNSEKRLTISIGQDLTVNSLTSDDSAFITVDDGLHVKGILKLLAGAEVDRVLDEDTMTTNSATALATQQSIKAYVDSQISSNNTLTVVDDASSSVTVDIETDSLKIAGGNSITTSSSGDTVTVALDSAISVTNVDATSLTVNTISSSDSSEVFVNDNLKVNGNLTITGTQNITNTNTTTIEDPFLVLNQGVSSPANLYDAGVLINRGTGADSSTISVAMIWDESANSFAMIETTEDGSFVGDIPITRYANLEVETLTGTATQARYADLAERYETDTPVETGDLVKIGGEKEITKTQTSQDIDVFGVVAENPALMMNSDAGTDETHPYITMTGRTKCKIVGPISKGDRICASSTPGVAEKMDVTTQNVNILAIIGRSLENNSSDGVKLVEVVLGKN